MKLKNRRLRDQKGFTLVELMIVVIIIGILTAVGVPLYLGYVKDAKAASAKAVIGSIVNAEKLYHQKMGTFVDVAALDFEADPDADPPPQPLGIDIRDATQFWTLSVTGADTDKFTVTAAGKAGTDYADTTVKLDYDRTADEVWTIT